MEVTAIQIVESFEKERVDFEYETSIYSWLGKVQKLDLRGFSKITLVNISTKHEEEDLRSLYFPKEHGMAAHCELCIERIQQDLPEDKKDDAEYLGAHIAFELFKQVGFNSLQVKHGIQKSKQEGYATGYAKKLFLPDFPGWKIEEGIPVKE